MTAKTNKVKIKRLGNYQEVDQDGYLIKVADVSNVKGKWLKAVTAVTQAYLAEWGDKIHSIYVRGSLVKGWAVENVSDLDTFAVLQEGIAERPDYAAWERTLVQALQAQFPFITGTELRFVLFETAVDSTSVDALIIKVEAACIYGEDVAERLPQYKPNADIAFQSRYFRHHLDIFLQEYPLETGLEKQETLVWIMRRFLRLGMELVMEREQRFTRDLTLCYESFAKYYPEQQAQMYNALELAINPVTEQSALQFAKDFGEWLVVQATDYLIGNTLSATENDAV